MSNATEVVTLTDFLLARIAEDEAIARATQESYDPLDWDGDGAPDAVGLAGPVDGPSGYTSVVIDPHRVLAECAAKRAIVHLHRSCGTGTGYCDDGGHGWTEDGPGCSTVAHLATVYADHPGYAEAWRP